MRASRVVSVCLWSKCCRDSAEAEADDSTVKRISYSHKTFQGLGKSIVHELFRMCVCDSGPQETRVTHTQCSLINRVWPLICGRPRAFPSEDPLSRTLWSLSPSMSCSETDRGNGTSGIHPSALWVMCERQTRCGLTGGSLSPDESSLSTSLDTIKTETLFVLH